MAKENNNSKGMKKELIPGLFLVGLGLIFLLNNFGFTSINFSQIWPLFLIIPGIFILMGFHRRN